MCALRCRRPTDPRQSGYAIWKNKRRQDDNRVGTFYYVCSAAIAKGESIREPISFQRGTLNEFVMGVVP